MSQVLLSVPPALRDAIATPDGIFGWKTRLAEAASDQEVFVGADPRARRLGSGGGTVGLLAEAWRASRSRGESLDEWLRRTKRLVLHAGGESRRLPAYAALGKIFMPMPAVEGLSPRRCDQMLADFQLPAYQQVLEEAGARAAVLITAGDVWLDFDPLQIPEIGADIAGIGMRVSPEVARDFGVFFVARGGGAAEAGERPIAFFRQKPSVEEIHRHSASYDFFVDTGMWLLSVEAVRFLFARCGWNPDGGEFTTGDGHPGRLDLYTEIGNALGAETRAPERFRRLGWGKLRCSVVPLEEARFYHLGSSRQLFESFEQLQRGQLSPRRLLAAGTPPAAVSGTTSLPVWVDSVRSKVPVELDGYNVVTNLPAEARIGRLAQGVCVDASPVGDGAWVVRPYQLDDTLRGEPGKGAKICGRDALAWLSARGLPCPRADVFQLPIYPVLRASDIDEEIIRWFFEEAPDPAVGRRLGRACRLSAAQIAESVDFRRLFAHRRFAREAVLVDEFDACLRRSDMRVFSQDFAALARCAKREAPRLRRWIGRNGPKLLASVNKPEHASRLLLLQAELAPAPRRAALTEFAYERLQESVVASNRMAKAQPRRAVKDDQIVWARSPVRLDLAGGWTDTPPYCLEHGGAVLNVAVLLNGQPPIQAFVRPLSEPKFILRSIDLGSAEEVTDHRRLAGTKDARSHFGLAKAALALAGFHPDFAAGRPPRSLRARLEAFGGGLELSLLSAVPKGSGLGTSSILAATVLGALNRACGLGWDPVDLYQRVMAVEQILTTGGGWQDQAGALFRSVKLVETQPGLSQTPAVRYLPEHLLGPAFANQTLLLYYTGVTRLAKGILKEIVHDMFLGRSSTLRTLGLIRANAHHLHRALQEGDQAGLRRCIARSWRLNKRLDPGTSTPEIERILALAGPDLEASKLLGAGGGGYMLMCASTPEAGLRIRRRLERSAPNPRARFIDFEVADRAVEVTVS